MITTLSLLVGLLAGGATLAVGRALLRRGRRAGASDDARAVARARLNLDDPDA
ncbi:hypothetical protein tb265_39280 [Gemmatimonadetes bacterium T265]|nr:hypothetical protein tb265_39280 [Gemmatimonadetes bacterium T265]